MQTCVGQTGSHLLQSPSKRFHFHFIELQAQLCLSHFCAVKLAFYAAFGEEVAAVLGVGVLLRLIGPGPGRAE